MATIAEDQEAERADECTNTATATMLKEIPNC
jgi:hypothetical protein